jgi:uncharacterized protein YdhG (YjbR/CyaY superfamily)
MTVIDEYLKNVNEAERSELERIRGIVKQVAPEAEEVISYGMPGFKYRGKYLVGFNAFRGHLSLFPTARPVEVLKDKLQGFKLSKGTVQFTPTNSIPESIIRELLLVRMADIAA